MTINFELLIKVIMLLKILYIERYVIGNFKGFQRLIFENMAYEGLN